ncbi:NAD-dependent epimerase/dehydratase family protein [Burkholderia pseudomallei]|uniref:NAD-dependent epimerase/dehydratase family protein n=1 Tax=Burkholderia pseudomallei TaxID=28450 RepID=UPI000572436E|nr:NAD-dependent epimerase/dehydratase family protein [Burkholderia pseudomallei]
MQNAPVDHVREQAMANLDMALVVGAAGGIGGEMVRALRGAGWRVRTLARSAPPGDGAADIDWRLGDASNPHDVAEAARGCAAIVHAVNPPGYRRWSEWVLPMLENTIAAAKRERATIVLPGTVYNYGPDAGGLLREDSPQHPLTRKGAIRVEMERRLRDATEAGARVLIVRAGDFFGPGARNNWFSQGLVKPGRPVRTVRAPGRAGVGHQWAYLPDVAQAMVELLARRDALDAFSRFHLAGHWDADGTRMSAAIRAAAARRSGVEPRVAAFPWWLVTLASPFVETLREMREMRYLWREAVRLDNARLVAALGREPHTPLEAAVETTLDALGCLNGRASRAAPSVR